MFGDCGLLKILRLPHFSSPIFYKKQPTNKFNSRSKLHIDGLRNKRFVVRKTRILIKQFKAHVIRCLKAINYSGIFCYL